MALGPARRASLIYALIDRCQDGGCTRKEIADTLGVEVDDGTTRIRRF